MMQKEDANNVDLVVGQTVGQVICIAVSLPFWADAEEQDIESDQAVKALTTEHDTGTES